MAFFTEEAIVDSPSPHVSISTIAAPHTANQNTISLSFNATTVPKNSQPPQQKFRRSKGGSFKRVRGGLVLVASMSGLPSTTSVEENWSHRWESGRGLGKLSLAQTCSSFEKAIQVRD
ncbi:hypothetical protein ABKN59_011851 [Abortiporus biennis]